MAVQLNSAKSRVKYWKATLRSSRLLDLVLLGTSYEEVRIFRWRLLALLVARRHQLKAPKGITASATVEPYIPGANVVVLNLRSTPSA